MIVISRKVDLERWVKEAWGDDDRHPLALGFAQANAIDRIRDGAYAAGISYGEDWTPLLDALPDNWRETDETMAADEQRTLILAAFQSLEELVDLMLENELDGTAYVQRAADGIRAVADIAEVELPFSQHL